MSDTSKPPPGSMPKDNPSHRNLDKKLDASFGGGAVYEKFTRPIIHGTYHAGRALGCLNYADWARAKDQYSKVGSGQPRTEYLAEYRAKQRAEEEAKK